MVSDVDKIRSRIWPLGCAGGMTSYTKLNVLMKLWRVSLFRLEFSERLKSWWRMVWALSEG